MNSLPLLQPVDAAQPCGPSLDYDPAHVLVMACLERRMDAQYGTFVDTPHAPDWQAIARDCDALLRRTRDISILVGLCRARLALARAPGLTAALGSLRAVLERWPDDVHPQMFIEGMAEPTVRANAIAALADPGGLLGEIGDLVVTANTANTANTAARLTVRDVERALAKPRAPDAAMPDVVAHRLQAAQADRQGEAAVQIRALGESAAHVRAIDAWSRAQLGDEAPSLARLLRLLAPFEAVRDVTQPMEKAVKLPKAILEKPQPAAAQTGQLARHDAAARIRAAREWFEMHEPSSPVAVLLKQAERMVGQRFVQVADAIPLDLLRQWDAHGAEIGE